MDRPFDVHKSLPPLDCPECQADLSYGEGRSGGYQYGPLVVIDCCPGCDAVTLVLLDDTEAIEAVYGLSDAAYRALTREAQIPERKAPHAATESDAVRTSTRTIKGDQDVD